MSSDLIDSLERRTLNKCIERRRGERYTPMRRINKLVKYMSEKRRKRGLPRE